MSGRWIATAVRGRGLLRRRLGRDGARRVARSPSLDVALADLQTTAYGREVRAGMDLAAAQHAASATTLWHMRILAGWGPPLGAGPLRILVARFEISNIIGQVLRVSGLPDRPPYELGSLATAWPAVSGARSLAEVRTALRSSAWGDPGGEELAAVRLGLQFAWARRVFDGVPGAAEWATTGAALLAARLVADGAVPALGPAPRRDAARLLGRDWVHAESLEDLVPRLGSTARRALNGVGSRPDDLWHSECRWWSDVDSAGAELVARPVPDCSTGVGVAAQLLTDGWRVRAALAAATAGGRELEEVFDGVA